MMKIVFAITVVGALAKRVFFIRHGESKWNEETHGKPFQAFKYQLASNQQQLRQHGTFGHLIDAELTPNGQDDADKISERMQELLTFECVVDEKSQQVFVGEKYLLKVSVGEKFGQIIAFLDSDGTEIPVEPGWSDKSSKLQKPVNKYRIKFDGEQTTEAYDRDDFTVLLTSKESIKLTPAQWAAHRLKIAIQDEKCYVATSPLRRAEETLLRGFQVFGQPFADMLLHRDKHLTEATKNVDSNVVADGSPERTGFLQRINKSLQFIPQRKLLEGQESIDMNDVSTRGSVPFYTGPKPEQHKHDQFKVRLHMEAALDAGWSPNNDVIVLNGHSLTAFQALRAWARDAGDGPKWFMNRGFSKMANGSVVETTIQKVLDHTRIAISKVPRGHKYAQYLRRNATFEAVVINCSGLTLTLRLPDGHSDDDVDMNMDQLEFEIIRHKYAISEIVEVVSGFGRGEIDNRSFWTPLPPPLPEPRHRRPLSTLLKLLSFWR